MAIFQAEVPSVLQDKAHYSLSLQPQGNHYGEGEGEREREWSIAFLCGLEWTMPKGQGGVTSKQA